MTKSPTVVTELGTPQPVIVEKDSQEENSKELAIDSNGVANTTKSLNLTIEE